MQGTASCGKRIRNGPPTRADLDQDVVPARRNRVDDACNNIRIDQKVLTETLARSVAGDH
jgi:hypothetical protein